MHHISVKILNDLNSNDDFDEFTDFLDDGEGDSDIFLQMWKKNDLEEKINENLNVENDDVLNSVHNAYKHMKNAVSEITLLKNVITNYQKKKGVDIEELSHQSHNLPSDQVINLKLKKTQLENSSNFLFQSAQNLRETINKNRLYFRELDNISKQIPLKIINNENTRQIAVQTPYLSTTSILLNEDGENIQWKLSNDSHFSFNNHSFGLSVSSEYLKHYFHLMCHYLFEKMKDDKIKSCIHYSADNNTKSVYFDIGNNDIWEFHLGEEKTISDIPLWIPKLMKLISNPKAQPASTLKNLLFYHSTLLSVQNSIFNRFVESQFCIVKQKIENLHASFEISSPHLQLPLFIYIDKSIVSITETPNEMRCLQYSTDGRGLSPALEKWCDNSFTSLFLSCIEQITRSFGFVFKNKNQYGTASIGNKKIKFKPKLNTSNIEILITSKNTKKIEWSNIPGINYIQKLCVLLFNDDE